MREGLLSKAVGRVKDFFTGQLQVIGSQVIEFMTAALTENPAMRPTTEQLLQTPPMLGMRGWRARLLADPTHFMDSFLISFSNHKKGGTPNYEAHWRQMQPLFKQQQPQQQQQQS
jgi:hypothetical protein